MREGEDGVEVVVLAPGGADEVGDGEMAFAREVGGRRWVVVDDGGACRTAGR